MKLRTILLSAAAVSLLACSNAGGKPSVAASAGCAQLGDVRQAATALYAPGNLYAAKPVRKKIFNARAIQPERTMGADLYLHAQQGVTPEYVERVLSCHAASGTAAHPNDPLHPESGRIAELSVRSAGPSLAVRVIGDSPATGKEIYQRAEAMTSSSGSVSVEQVASAAVNSTEL